MKLESLKKDKFEPFKDNEIQNAMKIIGGGTIQTNFHTTYKDVKYTGTDIYENGTNMATSPGEYQPVSANGNNADGTPHVGNIDYKRTSIQKVLE